MKRYEIRNGFQLITRLGPLFTNPSYAQSTPMKNPVLYQSTTLNSNIMIVGNLNFPTK